MRTGTKSQSSVGSNVLWSFIDHQWKTLLWQLSCFGEWFVSKYQSNADKHKCWAECRCKAKELVHISQLTWQDWRINCAGVSQSLRAPMRGSWAIMAIEIPGGLQFFTVIPAFTDKCGKHVSASQQDTLVHTYTFTQKDTHPLFCLHACRILCLLSSLSH